MPPLISAWWAIAVPPRLKRRSTRQVPLRSIACATNSPSTICSVKFFEPTITSRRMRSGRPTPLRPPTQQDDGEHVATARRAAPRIGEPSRQRKRAVAAERQQRGRDRAGEDHRRIHHRQAAEDVVAEPAGADRRRNRRGADANHHRDAQARHDRRQRQRPLHLRSTCRGVRPIATAHSMTARHALNAGDGAAQNRQDRVQRQRHQRRARADAADERQRDQESEQREARNGLRQVGERDDRLRDRRPPRREDAERNADRRRDRRGDEHQHHVLAEPRRKFGAVRRDERNSALIRGFVEQSLTTNAATRGSADARTPPACRRRRSGRRAAPRPDRRARTLR